MRRQKFTFQGPYKPKHSYVWRSYSKPWIFFIFLVFDVLSFYSYWNCFGRKYIYMLRNTNCILFVHLMMGKYEILNYWQHYWSNYLMIVHGMILKKKASINYNTNSIYFTINEGTPSSSIKSYVKHHFNS